MFRRFVCVLLIPMLIANQAIAMGCPHEHSGTEPDSHHDRPHIHIGFHHHNHHRHHDGNHAHDHGHDHSGHGDGHQHSHPTSQHSQNSASGDAEFPCGHDCDAVYFPVHELHFLPPVQQELISVGLALVAFAVVDWPQYTPSVRPSWTIVPRGPFSVEHCALYLQILCLRL